MTHKITPSQLFYPNSILGNKICYYCGNSCSDLYTTKEYVKKTFTNQNIVKSPSSKYICESCTIVFSDTLDELFINGELNHNKKLRNYSWVFNSDFKMAYSKKHISKLREIILNLPDSLTPPFVICLTDSGQKHLIFRSKVNWTKDEYFVTLEEENILVNPKELKKYIDTCIPLIAVSGKTFVADFKLHSIYITSQLSIRFKDSELLLNNFLALKNLSLLKLAVWLSPNKEECNGLLESAGI
jgi:CRISPR type IV-associated protein Csf1